MLTTNIKDRIKLYKYYHKLLNNTEDKNALFNKERVLGEGYQGKVYQYCKKTHCVNDGIAVKKMYLDWKEGKYVEDIYNSRALKYSSFIELASNQLINELVLQEISPNFILHYTHEFEERWSICAETYPYKSYFYNEFINNSETYTDWVSKEHSIQSFDEVHLCAGALGTPAILLRSKLIPEKKLEVLRLILLPKKLILKNKQKTF